MTEVTFSKDVYGDWVASTGERIGHYDGVQLWGRGSTGWYITEIDGEFGGWKFDTLRDAKLSVIRRHNPMQATKIVLDSADKVLARYRETVKNS